MKKKKEILYSYKNFISEIHHFQELGLIPLTNVFFPGGTHYPLITQYPSISYRDIYKNYKLTSEDMTDLYVHFPFCKKKCLFCHYVAMYNK